MHILCKAFWTISHIKAFEWMDMCVLNGLVLNVDFEIRLYVAYKQNSISSYVLILQLTIAPEKND